MIDNPMRAPEFTLEIMAVVSNQLVNAHSLTLHSDKPMRLSICPTCVIVELVCRGWAQTGNANMFFSHGENSPGYLFQWGLHDMCSCRDWRELESSRAIRLWSFPEAANGRGYTTPRVQWAIRQIICFKLSVKNVSPLRFVKVY